MALDVSPVSAAMPDALVRLCSFLNERHRLLEQLEEVASCSQELIAADHAEITLFDVTLRRFIPLRSTRVFIHQGEPDVAARVKETGRPILATDLNLTIDDQDLMLFNRDVSSYLAVPILDGPRVDGVLVVFNRDPRRYEQGEQETLQALASLAAVALRQKRLSLGFEETSRTLLKLSLTDPLTGMATREQFEQMLSHEWARALSDGLSISLLQLQLDGESDGESSDERHGQQLVRVTSVLRAALYRARDTIALLGSERLAVILPDTDQAGAQAIARRLQRDVAAAGTEEQPMPTLSIGLCTFDTLLLPRGVLGSPDKLMKHAALALERARRGGGGRVELLEIVE